MTHPTSSAWKIIPQFQSLSIPSTIHFYVYTLGFTIGGIHHPTHPSSSTNTEPTFCSLFIGNKAEANIYFSKCSPSEFHPRAAMIALGCEELDEFYAELRVKGEVKIVEKVADKEWGYRQFAVRDCDGNVITFFRLLEGENPGGKEEENGEGVEKMRGWAMMK
jgi:uncharacterized glyoxalase superfamily protein PhnB